MAPAAHPEHLPAPHRSTAGAVASSPSGSIWSARSARYSLARELSGVGSGDFDDRAGVAVEDAAGGPQGESGGLVQRDLRRDGDLVAQRSYVDQRRPAVREGVLQRAAQLL